MVSSGEKLCICRQLVHEASRGLNRLFASRVPTRIGRPRLNLQQYIDSCFLQPYKCPTFTICDGLTSSYVSHEIYVGRFVAPTSFPESQSSSLHWQSCSKNASRQHYIVQSRMASLSCVFFIAKGTNQSRVPSSHQDFSRQHLLFALTGSVAP